MTEKLYKNDVSVSQEEMDIINKMKSGYWVSNTTGMGYMWHIDGNLFDHKTTDDDLRIIRGLSIKGIVENQNVFKI